MSYEDLEAARTKRAEVEASKAAKKNTRERMRKGKAQRVDEQVSEVGTARADEVPALAGVSEQVMWSQPGECFAALCPGRAPTAPMW